MKRGPSLTAGPSGRTLAQAFDRQLCDRFVVVRSDEAGARIDVDCTQAIDNLLAQREDRHITLQERLLIRSQLDPPVLETLDDLRARIEADVDDVARALAGGLHVDRGISER